MSTVVILAVIIITMALLAMVITGEQKEAEYYDCYLRKAGRYEAGSGKCKGEENNIRCGHCLYNKNWRRENYHE